MTEETRKRYTALVDFLGKVLGPSFEVVLQDTDPDRGGIIAIANGELSGRHVGSPLTNTALRMIMDRRYERSDYEVNYRGKLLDGRVIRSSTFFIREKGRLAGFLCINFDDSGFRELNETLSRLIHPAAFFSDSMLPQGEIQEHFTEDKDKLMEDIYSETVGEMHLGEETPPADLRIPLIRELEGKGIFHLKGAVPFTAEKLGCSQASVYRYLSTVRKKEK